MYEKKLLNDLELPVLRKPSFRIILFTLLSFLMTQVSFAQQWAILGNESQISNVASSYTSIAVLNDVPYVVYREGTVSKVKKRNSSTGVWEQVGDNIGSNITYTRIYFDKTNNLLVTYVDASNGNKLAVKMYNVNDQVWQPLNNDVNNLYVSSGQVTNTVSQYSSTPRSSLAFDSDNNPYIAYGDGATLTPYVKKFDGNSWVAIGSGAVNTASIAVGVSLVIDEADVPWLVFCSLSSATASTGTMAFYQFSSGVWKSISTPVTASIRHSSMALNAAGNLAIAYFNTADTNRATVIEYNKNAATPSWSAATRLGSRDSPSLSLIRDVSGNLYCSFIDNVSSTATFSARVFKQSAGATAWTEMKDPTVINGIDSSVSNLTIAAGSKYPFVVYTKTNSSNVVTPIVRGYVPAIPIVLITQEISNFTETTAQAGGNITYDGGAVITERGVVYSTSSNPTTASTKIKADSAGSGAYTVNISGLNPSTLYYLRAYAINSGGTSYGDIVRLSTMFAPDEVVTTPKQMEFLNRGLVAVRKSASQVFISWRLLGNEPSNIAFNIYRDNVKLNEAPITTSTNYLDNTTVDGVYTVKAVLNGSEGKASSPASVWANNQLSIPLQIPVGGTTPDGKAYTYTANDASVGDVDGDGEYEIFLKWDPTVVNDNAGGYSGEQIFDCYKLDGTKLWRINLGKNVNAGPHYNPFMVYDFDGDGKAEMFLKTADGTIDGLGNAIGNANVDNRNTSGWVQQGPEFLTVFNGLTGAAMATIPYQPARGNTSDWGDNYGNRQDRFVSAVAYLDGARPSLIVGRGYYDKLVRAAYDWRDGKITLRWIFDSKDPNDPANNALSSQGNHQMTVGDVDGDGKDEIINGSSAINDNGKRLWTYGQGHGDALHMSDMDPDRPGMEIWQCLESPGQYSPHGIRLNDAKTGKMIFGVPTTGDVGRALAADIDPNHRGYEMWSSSGNLYNVQDGEIGTAKPTNGSQSVNAAVWWDGDLGRELLDGTIMDKWNPTTKSLNRLFTIYQAAPVSSNNSTKKNPCLTGDIFGDWREEIILRRSDNTALIVFTTNIPTDKRIYTLMHDSQYRTAVAWQNSGYNQPPHPSFFLGYDMAEAPTPNIEVKYISAPEVKNISVGTRAEGCDAVVDYLAQADAFPVPNYTYAFTGATTATGEGTGSGSTFNKGVTVVTVTASNSSGTVTYSFEVTVTDTQAPVLTTPVAQFLCYNETYIVPALEAKDNCAIASVSYEISGATERSGTGTDASGSFNVGQSVITWTVTDTSGNQSTAKTEVTVNAPLSVSIPDVFVMNQGGILANTIYNGYGPDSLTLNAIVQGGTASYSYSWNTEDTNSTISVFNSGTYVLTVTDAKGCSKEASITINGIDVSCGNNGDKVVICHNGKSLCIASSAVQDHLKHGCWLGACPGTAQSSVIDSDVSTVEVLAYPNPSKGQFSVQLSGYKSSNATIIITNSIGQIVAKKEVKLIDGKQTTPFNISNTTQSVYFLKVISSDDEEKTLKIFIGE